MLRIRRRIFNDYLHEWWGWWWERSIKLFLQTNIVYFYYNIYQYIIHNLWKSYYTHNCFFLLFIYKDLKKKIFWWCGLKKCITEKNGLILKSLFTKIKLRKSKWQKKKLIAQKRNNKNRDLKKYTKLQERERFNFLQKNLMWLFKKNKCIEIR